jgi:tRNA modification GTPase
LAERLALFKDDLVALIAEVEAWLDFPEDDLPKFDTEKRRDKISRLLSQLNELRQSHLASQIALQGEKVVICGLPNAGKSKLMNALCGRNVAIVSDVPGTTRDRLEALVSMDGFLVNLIDTAGLREEGDKIEKLGVALTREAIAASDVIVWVVDSSLEATEELLTEIEKLPRKPTLAAATKRDLPLKLDLADFASSAGVAAIFEISAVTGSGLPELRAALSRLLREHSAQSEEEIVITSARQFELITRAMEAAERALEVLLKNAGDELFAEDLRLCLHALCELTGEEVGERVLDEVFSKFCIGK